MTPAAPEIDFDPFDPRNFADPYPVYRRLRREAPVACRAIAQPRVWPRYFLLSRAADVEAALLDWRTFSSARGTLVDTDVSLIPPNIFHMDPPRHDELRGLLARVLTPARVAKLEPQLRASARALLEEPRATGRLDAATQYAQRIPTLTMCALMDLPTCDRAQFLKWSLDTLASSDFTSEVALRAYAEMGAYWEGLVAERRRKPGPDLISQILHGEVEGAALSDAEIGGFCSLLHDASQGTTMNMIGHSILTLGRHPDARRALASEPSRWPRALEELMRFVSPVQGLARCTTREVELHGVKLAAGEQLLLLYGSANHDESVWRDPERFDLERDARAHLGFGRGIHTCLGSSAARLEIRVALQVLLEMAPDWEVDEAGVVHTQLVPVRNLGSAPIRFD